MAKAGQVRRDRTQRECEGTQARRCLAFVQEEVIDVQALDEQVRRTGLFNEESRSVLVRVLDDLVVDHREVQARRRIVEARTPLGLLVYAAAVEHREQVSELERRQLAERQREEVARRQIRTVESDARAGQLRLRNAVVQQMLMQRGEVRTIVVSRFKRHEGRSLRRLVDCRVRACAAPRCDRTVPWIGSFGGWQALQVVDFIDF